MVSSHCLFEPVGVRGVTVRLSRSAPYLGLEMPAVAF